MTRSAKPRLAKTATQAVEGPQWWVDVQFCDERGELRGFASYGEARSLYEAIKADHLRQLDEAGESGIAALELADVNGWRLAGWGAALDGAEDALADFALRGLPAGPGKWRVEWLPGDREFVRVPAGEAPR